MREEEKKGERLWLSYVPLTKIRKIVIQPWSNFA